MVKYSPNRYYQYPVLRPNNDDWPNGELETFVEKAANNALRIRFQIEEPTIKNLIAQGKARCASMLYCISTLYSDMVMGDSGAMDLEIPVPHDMVAGEIELWPSIILVSDINLPTATAHQEYENTSISIAAYKPLVLDERWRIPLSKGRSATESLFIIETLDMDDGLFQVHADPRNSYISIRMNHPTSQKFEILRGNKSWALAAIYTPALAEVLQGFDIAADAAVIDGWHWAIRSKLQELNIQIEERIEQPWSVAQQIFGNPYNTVLDEQEARAEDEE